MKLYGAEVSQQYIKLTDNKKKLKHRYPRSEAYPWEAKQQTKWSDK